MEAEFMTIIGDLLEEGGKLFKQQKYEEAEKKYASGLRLAGDKYKLQLPFIIGLGNVYSQKSICLKDDESCIKATIAAVALYNYALQLVKKSEGNGGKKSSKNNDFFLQNNFQDKPAKSNEGLDQKKKDNFLVSPNDQMQLQKSSIENAIYTTNISFLKKNGIDADININGMGLESYRKKRDAHRNNLLKLRNEIKKEFKFISQENWLSHNIEQQQQNTKKIKDIYAKVAAGIQKIIIDIFEECRNELSQKLKKIPSSDEFAIIGFGSFGRREMTPYSDFEWGILLKDDKEQGAIEERKKYFRTLAGLMQVKIINLGETILPAIGIKFLNDYYNSDNQSKEDVDWFYDGVMPRGFSFDGAMPEACMFPLGCPGLSNGTGKFELIGTIDNFDKLLKRTDIREYFALELMENTFVYGNEKLFESYKKCVKKYIDDNSMTWKQKCLKVILGDIKKYLPDFSPQEIEGKFFHAKKDIYRLTDRIFSDIAAYYALDNRNALEVVYELRNKQVINDKVAQCLENVITIAWWFRLKTYLAFERQKDVISIFEIKNYKQKKEQKDKKEKEDKEEKIIEQQIDPKEIQLNNQLDNDCSVQKPPLVIKGKIKKVLFELFYTLLPWYNHLNNLAFSLPNSKNANISQEIFFPQSLYDDNDKNKGIIYKRLLDYPEAIKYFEEHLEKYKNDVQCTQLLNMLYFENAESKKLRHTKLEINELPSNTVEEKITLIGSFLNRGVLRCNEGYYDQAIEWLKKSLDCTNECLYGGENLLLK